MSLDTNNSVWQDVQLLISTTKDMRWPYQSRTRTYIWVMTHQLKIIAIHRSMVRTVRGEKEERDIHCPQLIFTSGGREIMWKAGEWFWVSLGANGSVKAKMSLSKTSSCLTWPKYNTSQQTACFIPSCCKWFTSLFNVLTISWIYHLCSCLVH